MQRRTSEKASEITSDVDLRIFLTDDISSTRAKVVQGLQGSHSRSPGRRSRRRVGGAKAGNQGRPSESFINYWKTCFCVGSDQHSFTRVSRRRRRLPGGAGTQGAGPGGAARRNQALGFPKVTGSNTQDQRANVGGGAKQEQVSLEGTSAHPSELPPSHQHLLHHTQLLTPSPPRPHPAPPATPHLPFPACSPAPSLMGPSPPQQRSIRSVSSLRTRLHPPDWLEPDRCWISSTWD